MRVLDARPVNERHYGFSFAIKNMIPAIMTVTIVILVLVGCFKGAQFVFNGIMTFFQTAWTWTQTKISEASILDILLTIMLARFFTK